MVCKFQVFWSFCFSLFTAFLRSSCMAMGILLTDTWYVMPSVYLPLLLQRGINKQSKVNIHVQAASLDIRSVCQLPGGLPPLPFSHLIPSTRNKAGFSTLCPCHPPRVQATSVSFLDSCRSLTGPLLPLLWPPGSSPCRNWRDPLGMYHIMLILYLNLPVTFHPTHCAKRLPQGSLPSTLLDLSYVAGLFSVHLQKYTVTQFLFSKNEIMLCIITATCFVFFLRVYKSNRALEIPARTFGFGLPLPCRI